jgi:hypothetical protein
VNENAESSLLVWESVLSIFACKPELFCEEGAKVRISNVEAYVWYKSHR